MLLHGTDYGYGGKYNHSKVVELLKMFNTKYLSDKSLQDYALNLAIDRIIENKHNFFSFVLRKKIPNLWSDDKDGIYWSTGFDDEHYKLTSSQKNILDLTKTLSDYTFFFLLLFSSFSIFYNSLKYKTIEHEYLFVFSFPLLLHCLLLVFFEVSPRYRFVFTPFLSIYFSKLLFSIEHLSISRLINPKLRQKIRSL